MGCRLWGVGCTRRQQLPRPWHCTQSCFHCSRLGWPAESVSPTQARSHARPRRGAHAGGAANLVRIREGVLVDGVERRGQGHRVERLGKVLERHHHVEHVLALAMTGQHAPALLLLLHFVHVPPLAAPAQPQHTWHSWRTPHTRTHTETHTCTRTHSLIHSPALSPSPGLSAGASAPCAQRQLVQGRSGAHLRSCRQRSLAVRGARPSPRPAAGAGPPAPQRPAARSRPAPRVHGAGRHARRQSQRALGRHAPPPRAPAAPAHCAAMLSSPC